MDGRTDRQTDRVKTERQIKKRPTNWRIRLTEILSVKHTKVKNKQLTLSSYLCSFLTVDGNKLSVRLHNLKKYTTYFVWVTASTSVGPGPRSSKHNFTTEEDSKFIYFSINLLLPNISMHFLHIVLYRICVAIKSILFGDHFLYSRNLNVWFRGDIVRRN